MQDGNWKELDICPLGVFLNCISAWLGNGFSAGGGGREAEKKIEKGMFQALQKDGGAINLSFWGEILSKKGDWETCSIHPVDNTDGWSYDLGFHLLMIWLLLWILYLLIT